MAARVPMPYSTGLELILCSCERELYMVLTEDEELICATVWALQDRATELLAPSLERMFALAGKNFSDLRRIGCVRGPGSFTGIRLVLATASALRRTTRAQLAALDYMQALATTLAMQEHLLYGRTIWIVTHARRNLVHCTPFLSYGPVIPAVALRPVELLTPDQVQEQLAACAADSDSPVLVAGSALTRQKDFCAALEAMRDQGIATRSLVRPSIDALRLLGRHGDYFPKDVEPLYIRPCDAVDNLPSLSVRMGRDPEQSEACLERLLHVEPGDQSRELSD